MMRLRRSVDRFLRAVVPFTGLFTVTSGPFDCGGGGACRESQEEARVDDGKVEGGTVSLDDSGDRAFAVPLRGVDDGERGGWRCFGKVTGRAVRAAEDDGSSLPIPLTASITCMLSDSNASVTKRVWTFSLPLPESRLAAPPSGETPVEIETNLSRPAEGATGCNAVIDGTIATVVTDSSGSAARSPRYVTSDFVRDLAIAVRFTPSTAPCGLRSGSFDIDVHLDATSYTEVGTPICL